LRSNSPSRLQRYAVYLCYCSFYNNNHFCFFFTDTATTEIYTLSLHDALPICSSRSSYFATFRHQLTILSKTDALDEEKWLNMLGTFVKDWFRYESHFVHGRDSLVDILKERGLLSESDAVQPLIGKKS